MFPWVKWIPAFGYSFKHDHYSMGKFPCKAQCCASLYFLHANLVPSYFKKNCKFDADMVKCIYHDIIWAKNVDLDKYM